MSRRACSLLAAALLLAGCAHHRSVEPLRQVRVDEGYRFLPPAGANSDSLLVILAFSGGGTRAAAFSYGVLTKLSDVTIDTPDGRRPLLEEVDLISSVSGGSVTAMYYGLHGRRTFDSFRPRFLDRNVQRSLLARAFLSPRSWIRLPSRHFDRIDVAAEYFDRELFDGKRYADLARERPLIVLNATDTATGARFEFTQDQFDLLCSDLGSVPLARGVAASAAFPFLLSPLTVEAHPRGCGYQRPEWVANALEERGENSRRFQQAQRLEHYLRDDVRFVHLLDGGVSDNIGLRGIIQSLSSGDSLRSEDPDAEGFRTLLQMVNLEAVDTILVVAANARTKGKTDRATRGNAPQLLGVMSAVSTIPMGNYSFETVELLEETMSEWTKDAQAAIQCNEMLDRNCPAGTERVPETHPVKVYAVELAFESIEDAARRERLLDLPTTFHLAPAEVDDVVRAAGDLLDASRSFQEFLAEHGHARGDEQP